jgi:glycosyltransferase involved in cell wall biosynthesis
MSHAVQHGWKTTEDSHEGNVGNSTDRPSSFSLSVLVPVYNERHLVEAALKRLLALKHELINSLQPIVVDDCSDDGTWDVLRRLAREDERLIVMRHDQNRGKGAAIRTALARATGDICIVHDADLEYHPDDIPSLLVPFAREGADAVFGSRYLPSMYRRTLMYRHTLMNKFLTAVSNWFSDLNLSDMETGYKAINTDVLKSIPLRSNDFRFEVEITLKLAKRRARIFEVPIRYLPRSYEEGKKIRGPDGLRALIAMLQFWIIDDIYHEDEYGSAILVQLESARKFNLWMGETLRGYVGDRVLEIGAGIGNLTNQFIPRESYVASDINPHYLHYLRSYAHGKPYLGIRHIDAGCAEHFAGLESHFDTVLMINVLEHVPDEQSALRNIWSVLQPKGRAIILVPSAPSIYGTLDEVLGHRERYTRASLQAGLESAGFRVKEIFDFNRCSVPGWWLNGKILKRKTFSRVQLKILNTAVPLLKRIDRLWPWDGLSWIAIAEKE